MYWPRLRLTADEAKKWTPYSAPDLLQRNVLYRAYAGEIVLDMTNKEDTETIQISRRSRVFALTASGDVHNIEVQIFDSAGEQYTMGYIPMANLLCGTAADERGWLMYNAGPVPGITPGTTMGFTTLNDSIAPHIFEPNIVLDPNQTLSFRGRTMRSLEQLPSPPNTLGINGMALLSFTAHVWEFPVE